MAIDAAAKLREWREHPAQMVRELFHVVPDAWQEEALEVFPHHRRVAMKASKGPGKTATESWLAWNYLLTRPHPRILATSVTGDNLADGLWSEMSKWQKRSEILAQKFTWTRTRIVSNEHPETWWMSARTYPKSASEEEQANTLAGIHEDYTLAIIDECGDIPPAVLVSAEAMLSTGKEGHVLIGGNTNSVSGMLYECCVTNVKRWYVVTVTGDPEDPKRSPRVSIEWAQDLIDQYGRDNDFVKVNVLGQFPSGSFTSLVTMEDIKAAQARNYREHDIALFPRILGVDVAYEGDDASVIFKRQGPVAYTPERFRNVDPHVGAGLVSNRWRDWDADAVFIDNTGGYGAGWISHLRLLQRQATGVGFAQSANDDQFYNKRAEIYWLCGEWIKSEGMLPPANTPGMAELAKAMTQTNYSRKRGKGGREQLFIEPKEIIKAKIGFSPDDADALCLTFSQYVPPRSPRRTMPPPQRHQEWSPRAALDADGYGMFR